MAGVRNVQRMVHLSSASMYPLFAWLRGSPSERRAFEGRTFLRVWSLAAIAGVLLLGSQYFSPSTVGIRLSTRPSSGITSRKFCWPRWLPREPATRRAHCSWWRAKAERPRYCYIGGRAGSVNL